MHGKIERHLVETMIVVSLALTGLTVWAVARQGLALRDRQWADLRHSAERAASERLTMLRTRVERLFEAGDRAWSLGGEDEFGAWIAGQHDWLLAYVMIADDPPTAYPRTPLEQPLPAPEPEPEPVSTGDLGINGRDLLSSLRDFRKLEANPDPFTRAGALLAVATCEQQLGHPLAAARIFTDAAQLLRSMPQLARYAFRAETLRINSLIEAGDHDRARAAYTDFLKRLIDDHPARLGPADTQRLDELAQAIGLSGDDSEAKQLAELHRRGQQRQAVLEAGRQLLQTRPWSAYDDTLPIDFARGVDAAGQPFIMVTRPAGENARFALLTRAAELLARDWPPELGNGAWQVRLPDADSDQDVLLKLGPEYANAVIEPTPETADALGAAARHRLGVVIATAAGMAGAWVLVIWMMIRVVARQRELGRLQRRFVADVSHELKTPLALIRLLADTLADRRVDDPQRIQAYHETISRESERLSLLLDNILDMGRIESGRKQYEFTECNPADIARQAWTLFEPRFSEDGFNARMELPDDLPTIRADAQALEQVIVNLLQNAYRYSGPSKYVRLSLTREGYVVIITVEDHGIGMNRSQLNRLGESFFRADDTVVRQKRGTGLGLAIVNHIVVAHGGKLEVQSQPGQGSKFSAWIPFQPAAKP